MVSYNDINSFPLDEPDKFLFFDIFYRNKEVVLICPVYGINTYKIQHDAVEVLFNNAPLKMINVIRKLDGEAVVIIIFSLDTFLKEVKLTVRFEKYVKDFVIANFNKEKPHLKLAQTTLFKDDYELIPNFVEWYIKQGVEYFYLYYNGIIPEHVKSICNKFHNIQLLSWNFIYWNKKSEKGYLHHAQVGQIHHALYKYGKPLARWMLFNDLDEYIYTGKTNLAKKIIQDSNSNNRIQSIAFMNHWAEVPNINAPCHIPKTILISEKPDPYPQRSKCVHRCDKHQYISIHRSHLDNSTISFATDCKLLHFYTWSGSRNNTFNNKIEFTML